VSKTCATCVEKIRNLAARKDNINNVEETFTYDNYVQDPTSQQSFNRYAYCLYNPLRYTDPSGYLCGNPPPHEFEIMRYLMCMNSDNAQTLNELGIEWIDVAHVSGSSDYTVRWVEGNNEYSMDYSGYIDSGYHGDGVYYPYSDGALPTPPAPMFYNCSYQGNYGIPVNGGNGGSACGSSSSNNSHLKHAIGSAVAGRYLSHNEKKYYNKETTTWTGKNGKQYGFNFKGNQYIGGIYKFGRRMSRLFKIGNVSLAFGNAIYIWSQHESGEIDGYDMVCGEAANVVSQIGWFGFFFNIGWEGVQYLRDTEQYQELRFRIQYNKELRYLGEPNQINQELWEEWYKNYRP